MVLKQRKLLNIGYLLNYYYNEIHVVFIKGRQYPYLAKIHNFYEEIWIDRFDYSDNSFNLLPNKFLWKICASLPFYFQLPKALIMIFLCGAKAKITRHILNSINYINNCTGGIFQRPLQRQRHGFCVILMETFVSKTLWHVHWWISFWITTVGVTTTRNHLIIRATAF